MDAKNIGSFIASLRKEKRLTQMELAKLLDVSDKAVSKWESGAGYPDIAQFPVLANIFQVSVDDLMRGAVDTEVGTRSLLETAVKNGSVVGVQKIIVNGVNITRSDEYGKNVIDYTLKYNDHNLFLFLMEKRILRIDRSFFCAALDFRSSKSSVELDGYWENSYTRVRYEHDTHHDGIVELLIRANDFETLRKLCFLTLEKPHVEWKSPSWKKIGRKVLKLSKEILDFISLEWNQNMVAFLCGLDSELQPDNYMQVAEAVGKNSTQEHQIAFVSMVYDYNKRAEIFNSKEPSFLKRMTWMEVATLQAWMPEAVIDDRDLMAWMAPRIEEKLIGETQFQRIVAKHGIEIFGNNPISFKVMHSAHHVSDNDFLPYIRTLYTKDLYANFPILEVLKRSPKIPELDQDILVYCLAIDRSHLLPGRDYRTILLPTDPSPDPWNRKKTVKVLIKEVADWSFLPDNPNPQSRWGKGNTLFSNIIRFGSEEVLRNVINVFWSEARAEAMIQLLDGGDDKSVRRLIVAEKTYLDSKQVSRNNFSGTEQKYKVNRTLDDSKVLGVLAKTKEMIERLVDLFDESILDVLLNDHCADTDFERMKLLIDRGAMFLTKYSETKDDGDETWKELVVVRDGKRTAIMREMLKKI
jgi:transcriptional regulator with XRE-family HTH domain